MLAHSRAIIAYGDWRPSSKVCVWGGGDVCVHACMRTCVRVCVCVCGVCGGVCVCVKFVFLKLLHYCLFPVVNLSTGRLWSFQSRPWAPVSYLSA